MAEFWGYAYLVIIYLFQSNALNKDGQLKKLTESHRADEDLIDLS